MPSTGKSERFVACVVVVALHLLLGWMGLRAARVAGPAPTADALQVTWIEARSEVTVPRVTARPRKADQATDQPPGEPVLARQPDVAGSDALQIADPSTDALDMSAVFIEQGRRWAAEQAPTTFTARNPLEERRNPLRESAPERFRMRPPPSPRAIVQAIGAMFGGAAYNADPCIRIRENLAALSTGSDASLTQEEVRRERARCAP